MRPALKLSLFAAVLAAALGLGALVGSAVGPIDVGKPDHSPAEHEH